jgi:hypothetical protein
MAFRRSALMQIGGFDEDLGPGTKFSCDDADAIARAAWHGIHEIYDPRIIVFHDLGRKGAEADRLPREYDEGRGAYYAKMVLGSGSRRTYLRIWRVKTVEDLKAAPKLLDRWLVTLTLLREILGAARYLIHLIRVPSKVPAP